VGKGSEQDFATCCVERRERMYEKDDVEKMLKRLKKDFQRNIQPALKKHSYFVSKGERVRLKRAKAIRRMRRRERQFSRAA